MPFRDGPVSPPMITGVLGLTAFPFSVFVDCNGEIAGRATGELPIETVESVIGRLGGDGG